MRILITGGAGFIGSHLAEALLAQQHDVVVLDDLSTGDFTNLRTATESDRFRFVEGSVHQAEVIEDLVGEVEFVYHLAAMVGVERVIEDPVRTIETNIVGTRNVMEAAARRATPVVYASTSEVYGGTPGESRVLSEAADLILPPTVQPRASYAASKIVGEILGSGLHAKSYMPCCCVRLFSVIGARQSPAYGMVVPRFVNQALLGKPITVYGTGEQTRCFTSVRDVVRLLVALRKHPFKFQILNYGSDREASILEVAALIKRTAESESEICIVPYSDVFGEHFRDSKHRVPHLVAMRRTRLPLPQVDLESAISETIHFFRSQLDA